MAAARYAYLLLAVAVGCSLTSMVAAQERPFDTTACALTQHPDKYNEGLVSVEGLITVGPEEATSTARYGWNSAVVSRARLTPPALTSRRTDLRPSRAWNCP